MTTPEENLWVAVIAQAFSDGSRYVPKGKNVHWKNDTAIARQWLKGTSKDFQYTCYLASVDPEWVSREWKALESGEKTRGKKKKYKIPR
mgnify:FL=1